MEVNAFKTLIDRTENTWHHVQYFGVLTQVALNQAGYDEFEATQLSRVLVEMTKCGFLEIHPKDPLYVKIQDHWYGYKSV